MSQIVRGVMQVVDSLEVGGTETVAVNLANCLPRKQFRNYLCNTWRTSGSSPLAATLRSDVTHLSLGRTSRFDLVAAVRFRKFVHQANIRLLHVHGSSLFFGRMASLLSPSSKIRLVWHDHCGFSETNSRSPKLYRLALAGAAGVIAVNQRLADWARLELRVPPQRVWYVPNFVTLADRSGSVLKALPGRPGSRIVCVANLRPQKDHSTLIRAMAIVRKQHPEAHLLLAGAPVDPRYANALYREVADRRLENNITFLGQVSDIASILRTCDVAVLSSISEGLPLSLLEYGSAGLPSIATSVGQCAEVLDHGKAGILVPPGSAPELATAIQRLLDSPDERNRCGHRFQEFVQKTFDPQAIIGRICDIYDQVLGKGHA